MVALAQSNSAKTHEVRSIARALSETECRGVYAVSIAGECGERVVVVLADGSLFDGVAT